MRYIDNRSLEMSQDWADRAATALTEVAQAAEKDRPEVFRKHARVWGDLKDELRKLSYKKCWYCESIDIRADNAVDHFRPKGRVKDTDPPHGGYWWLAFEWKNYRFACTYCNSPRAGGGKADHFPLADEKRRARSAQDYIDDEDPLLLDPTSPLDSNLLAFSENGEAGPAVAEDAGVERQKGERTIKCYNLNQPDLIQQRLARIRQVKNWVDEADADLARASAGDVRYRRTADKRMQDIVGALAASAPYSSAVRHFLAGLAKRKNPSQAAISALKGA